MGFVYWKTGRVDEAIDAFQKALTRNNHLRQAHAVMGILLSERGQDDEAITHYTTHATLRLQMLFKE